MFLILRSLVTTIKVKVLCKVGNLTLGHLKTKGQDEKKYLLFFATMASIEEYADIFAACKMPLKTATSVS